MTEPTFGPPQPGKEDPTQAPPSGGEPPVKRINPVFKVIFVGMVAGLGIFAGMAGLLYLRFARDLPNIIQVEDYRPPLVTQVIASGPTSTPGAASPVIAEFKKEQRRFIIPYDKIPEKVVQAFVSAEDEKFFQHPGIDIVGILRAAFNDLRSGRRGQGGSTITQQVTRALILTSEKTYTRKIKEILLARKLEQNLTKQQILYLYLNEIYLGHGAYGIEGASRTYFRKPVAQLTLAEAAILAGLPQAPGKYSPLQNPKRAKERQTYVLRRMHEDGYISDQQMTEALAESVRVYEAEDVNSKTAPYYMEYVRQYLIEKYGESALYEGGLTVYVPTTRELSLAAQKSVRDGLESVDKRAGYRGPIQHLKPDEVPGFLDEVRLKLVQKKFESQVLLPDGKLDPLGVLKLAGISTDEQLLEAGDSYQAVVTEVNDARKIAVAKIGHVQVTIPMENMKWARIPPEPGGTTGLGPVPKIPSTVLKKDDVILVRIESMTDGAITASLNQEPLIQGALLSLETQTGYVLAMVGGLDYGKSEFNRAIQALRQPGSAFKPILYSAALERGFTPASIVVDSPIVYHEGDLGTWKPSNFEEKFYGDTTFRQALIHSRNVPSIKILQQVQVPYLINYAKRLGVTSDLPADLSIALGSAGLSLMELTRVYALFPRLGRKIEPIFILKVVDRDGKVLEENKPVPLPATPRIGTVAEEPAPSGDATPLPSPSARSFALPSYPPADDPAQVLDPRVAFVMTHLMKEVVAFGTGQEAQQLGRPAAGKTGTTSDYIDAWWLGFTPYVVTGTWVGYDNHRPIGPLETGARAALPLWLQFMRDVTQTYPPDDFQVPPGIVFASIDQNTGKLAPPNSLKAIKEAFIEGTEPKTQAADDNNRTDDPTQSEFFKEDLE